MTCQKPFTITIDPDVTCPDWSTLLWGPGVIIGTSPPNATGSFVPTSAPGNIFTAQAAVDDFGAGFFQVDGQNIGELNYDGSGCNCQVEINFTAIADPLEASGSVQIQQAGFVVLPVQSFNSASAGVFTFPFSLINTGGVPELVQVIVSFSATNILVGGPSSMNLQGTLSNV